MNAQLLDGHRLLYEQERAALKSLPLEDCAKQPNIRVVRLRAAVDTDGTYRNLANDDITSCTTKNDPSLSSINRMA